MTEKSNRAVRRLISAAVLTLGLGMFGVFGPMSSPARAYGSATYSSSCSCSYGIKWCTNPFSQTYSNGYC